MNTTSYKIFFTAFFLFIFIDLIWLGFIAKNAYYKNYEPWLNLSNGQLKPIWWASLLVYLLFALSIVVFIQPLANGSIQNGAIYGALLGAIIYGVYDFTCLAIFKNFPLGIGIIDWIWGTALFTITSVLTTHLYK